MQVPYFRMSILVILTRCSIDDHQDSPQSAHDQGLSNFADGSGPIFSMYLEMATEEDKRMAENWKADAEGILFFVCRYIQTLKLHLR